MAFARAPCSIAPVRKTVISMAPRVATLPDGTSVVTRPVTPPDGIWLTRGLKRLSPQGNAYRFLHHRKRFTEPELHYLTHCDFVDHIGLVLGILDADGREVDGVGVARCIRSPEDSSLAEAAIVFVDEWQNRGAGKVLLHHLADLALQAGIRRWQTFIHHDNRAAERLFRKCGDEISRGRPGFGVNEILYRLKNPLKIVYDHL